MKDTAQLTVAISPAGASILGALGGILTGAAAMYFGDPYQGRRRRHVLRDRTLHVVRVVYRRATGIQSMAMDHGRGMAAETVARLEPEEVEDSVLVERVRARLGHLIHHPHHIHVSAQQGTITLRGQAPAEGAARAAHAAEEVRGVKSVINLLTRPAPAQPDPHEEEATQVSAV